MIQQAAPILKFAIVLLATLGLSISTNAQNYSISGYVVDSASGEALPNASLYVAKISNGCITNAYGYYSLGLTAGKYSLKISYVGYKDYTLEINLDKNTLVNVHMKPVSLQMEEVEISAEKTNEAEKNLITPISSVKLTMKEIKSLPVLFGENDLLKTLQLMPGVQAAGDGNAGFYVRGGGIDQNLILLDEALVYNATHLMGFFSVFNPDAIKSVELIKGGIPANYGGRLSSVVNVHMKEGNMQDYHISGGIGLISSRLMIEGPIVKDQSSFVLTGRRTYGDLFLPLFSNPELSNSLLNFYDVNIKANYKLGSKDRVFVSGYTGSDQFKYIENFYLKWGNNTATIRWNHLFNEKLFSNTSFIISNYNYYIRLGDEINQFAIQSLLNSYQLKSDFYYYRKPESTIRTGYNLIYHRFNPANITSGEDGPLPNTELDKKKGLEGAVYFMHEAKRFSNFSFVSGLRLSFFGLLAPETVQLYNNGHSFDTLAFKTGFVKTYFVLEPRISAIYSISESSSVKFSISKTSQFLHLLSNSTTSKPTDIWTPSSYNVKPQIARQYAMGYYKDFFKNMLQTSVELYYKSMLNQIDYRDNADLLLNSDIESQLVTGRGWSYGIEFFVKYNNNKWHGWVAYTWSKTERKFEEINHGKTFPAKNDRRHDISVVTQYQLNKYWSFSTNWVFYSGNAATFPAGKYQLDNTSVNLYTERNGYRMPDYHRLDVAATYRFISKKLKHAELVLSIYNLYNHENAYSIDFKPNENNPAEMQAVQLTLFKIIPSITFNFQF